MRTLGVWLCPAFGEGFTHAVTWWLLGTTETNYSRLPTTVSGAKQQELREPRELLQALRAEVAAGTEFALRDIPTVRWDNFREPVRRRAWTFMVWLIARHPDRWLQLTRELRVDRIQYEQIEATFRKVLEREVGEVDEEWRDWVRADSPLGRAKIGRAHV